MSTETATPAADTVRPERPAPCLSSLSNDATMLLGLAEALDVLHDHLDGPENCPIARRARNGMIPAIDSLIDRARRLADDIDAAESAYRRALQCRTS